MQNWFILDMGIIGTILVITQLIKEYGIVRDRFIPLVPFSLGIALSYLTLTPPYSFPVFIKQALLYGAGASYFFKVGKTLMGG